MDVVITYETLFDILRKEKSRAELQELPENFYGYLLAYLQQQQSGVDAQQHKAMIQYRNVQKILRELYERRERKIIEMALNRARTESNLIDTSALLEQEHAFFEEAALLLKGKRHELLEKLLAGTPPTGVVIPVVEEAKEPEAAEAPTATAESTPESCNVKFLAAVPKFLGLGGKVHGPFSPGDTAELPGKIADVLIRKKRVEMV